MKKLRISVNPLDKVKENAEKTITAHFLPKAIDIVHDRKRQLAEKVLAGRKASPEFKAAAEVEGLSAAALARIVVAKPHTLMLYENERRTAIMKVRAATDPEQIRQILEGLGILNSGLRI